MSVAVLDESKTATKDMTAEIKQKANEHLFVYTVSPIGLLTVEITDKDTKNLPLGLMAKVQGKPVVSSTTAGTDTLRRGMLKVQLRHQPGTKDGSALFGSDDINVDLPVWVRK